MMCRLTGVLALAFVAATVLCGVGDVYSAKTDAKDTTAVDFSGEKVGEAPRSFVPVVGNWRIGKATGR